MPKVQPQTPDIEQYIQKCMRTGPSLPEALMADIRYFEKRAHEGAVISLRGIVEWAQQKYGLTVGRTRLYNEAVKAGVKPWWTK